MFLTLASKVSKVVEGLQAPTTMAFLGPDDFLVLEKNNGTVIRVLNGKILNEPLLDINVANSVERGMCGIAVSKNVPRHMFSYILLKLREMMAMIEKESNQSETGFTDMNLWMTSL